MLTVRRVQSPGLRDQIYALRHRAYLREGAIEPHPSGRFSDAYDEQPNHVLWALFDESRLVGSLRSTWLIPGSAPSIPERDCFPEAIERRLPPGARLISGNRLVTEPRPSDVAATYATELLKHHLALMPGRADFALAAVRANHLRFYRNILLMECISEARIYPGLKCPMFLLAAEISRSLFPIWRRTPALCPGFDPFEAAA